MFDYLQIVPSGQKVCTDDEVSCLFKIYRQLLTQLSHLFIILCKKRYHVSAEDITKARFHQDNIEKLWYIHDMNSTPKLHILLDHACDFLKHTQGFGDLGEDAGERAHQLEGQNENRVGAIKDNIKKENCKSQFKHMN